MTATPELRAPATPAPTPRGPARATVDRRDDDLPPAAPGQAALRLCRCGHEQDAHDHFRGGTDCGICGATRCGRFRQRTGRAARSSAPARRPARIRPVAGSFR